METPELEMERLSARCAENPDSPLFARLADLYLAEHRADDALPLCLKGVATYPSYAAGHIVLGRCYQELGSVSKARSAFHRALDLSPFNTIVQRLLVALPDEPPREDTPALADEDARPAAPMAAEAAREQTAPIDVQEFPIASAEDEHEAPAQAIDERDEAGEPDQADVPPYDELFPTFEDYLQLHPASEPLMTLEEYLKGRSPLPPAVPPQAPAAEAPDSSPVSSSEGSTDFESLALQLQSAKRLVPIDPAAAPPPSVPADAASGAQATIVTQTMAEIYVAQNEFKAAIDAYTELIKKQPEQAQAFRQRIDAIKLLIGDVE